MGDADVLAGTLGSLANLRSLAINSTDLTQVPSSIEMLTALTNLVLHSNQVTNIPLWVLNMGHLRELSLTRVPALELPDDAISSLRSPSYLRLSDCDMPWLPAGIGELCDTLVKLDISRNPRIVRAPPSFAMLRRVVCLRLTACLRWCAPTPPPRAACCGCSSIFSSWRTSSSHTASYNRYAQHRVLRRNRACA